MEKNLILTAKSIFVEPTKVQGRLRFSVNNNQKTSHTVSAKEMYKIISPFFKNETEKLIKLKKLIYKSESFEVDTQEKKIYKWQVSKETLINEKRREARKKLMTPEQYKESQK